MIIAIISTYIIIALPIIVVALKKKETNVYNFPVTGYIVMVATGLVVLTVWIALWPLLAIDLITKKRR